MQYTLEGTTKDAVAIARIQAHAPSYGFALAFSGGRDSVILKDLAIRSGIPFTPFYSVTGIDPPELVQFIREHHPETRRLLPAQSIWKGIKTNGLPRRTTRWCCRSLKEGRMAGHHILLGIRWAESTRRKATRRMVESCYHNEATVYVNPIIDWSNEDVRGYIKERQLPYCSLYDEGFTRLGCILCPMKSKAQKLMEVERWPKIAGAWKRSAYRYWEDGQRRGLKGTARFSSPEAFWRWWLHNESIGPGEDIQPVIFGRD